jgi:hypothetical protein
VGNPCIKKGPAIMPEIQGKDDVRSKINQTVYQSARLYSLAKNRGKENLGTPKK